MTGIMLAINPGDTVSFYFPDAELSATGTAQIAGGSIYVGPWFIRSMDGRRHGLAERRITNITPREDTENDHA